MAITVRHRRKEIKVIPVFERPIKDRGGRSRRRSRAREFLGAHVAVPVTAEIIALPRP